MKPLTVKELRGMPIGECVWLTNETGHLGRYVAKARAPYEEDGKTFNYDTVAFSNTLSYADYGIKWLAYKNKEGAEGKYER